MKLICSILGFLCVFTLQSEYNRLLRIKLNILVKSFFSSIKQQWVNFNQQHVFSMEYEHVFSLLKRIKVVYIIDIQKKLQKEKLKY